MVDEHDATVGRGKKNVVSRWGHPIRITEKEKAKQREDKTNPRNPTCHQQPKEQNHEPGCNERESGTVRRSKSRFYTIDNGHKSLLASTSAFFVARG
jgi:hypothetical protein